MHIMMLANDTTFVYNLRREALQAFAQAGHQVTVVGQNLAFCEELAGMGFGVVDVQTGRRNTNPLQDLQLWRQYRRILRQYKPDLVFTNNIKPNVYGGLACKGCKIPYVANITGLGTAVENPGLLQKLTTRLYKWGVSGAQCVFFQNTENEAFFRDRKMLGKRSRTVLLPGSGVNLESHPVLPYPQGDKTHFLFVARVLKEKGIDQYLAAARALRAERDDVVFHICGGCDDAAYIQILEQAQADGVVEYHGQQKHMQPFVEQAACVVHPSYYPEGMSNVLLEAAAAGRPIIAADRSGCRETVEHGKTGYVVPIKDAQAVIDAIHSFLDLSWDARCRMGLAGREKMEREFDRKLVVAFYLKEMEAAGK